jgi:hypothetical protein
MCYTDLTSGGHNSPAPAMFIYFVVPTILGGAVALVSLGSLLQFILHKQPAYFTVFTDIGLFVIFRNIIVHVWAIECSN